MQTAIPITNMPAKLSGRGEVRSSRGEVIVSFIFTINYNQESSEVNDDLIYEDLVSNLRMKATTFDSLVVDGNHAWFSGVGVMDNRQAVRFSVEVFTQPDRFYISIPVLGGYVSGGVLAGGDLRIV